MGPLLEVAGGAGAAEGAGGAEAGGGLGGMPEGMPEGLFNDRRSGGGSDPAGPLNNVKAAQGA